MSKFKEQVDSLVKISFRDELTQKLDKESLKDFYEALDNPKISAPVIVKALKEFGIVTSSATIVRMRKSDVQTEE